MTEIEIFNYYYNLGFENASKDVMIDWFEKESYKVAYIQGVLDFKNNKDLDFSLALDLINKKIK